MQLAKQKSALQIKACSSAHIEATRGSAEEADAYCSKEETRVSGPFMFGTMRPDGRVKRHISTSDKYLLQVKDGTFDPHSSDAAALFLSRNATAVRVMQTLQVTQSSFDTKVFIHFGVPGSGKTFNARTGIYDENNELTSHMSPEQAILHTYEVTMYQSDSGTPWFDGYRRQKRIVINEFGRGKFKYADLLTLCDNYPGQFQAKGTSVQRHWDEVHITSNADPREWYSSWSVIDAHPFLRRITKVIKYTRPHQTVSDLATRSWDDIIPA